MAETERRRFLSTVLFDDCPYSFDKAKFYRRLLGWTDFPTEGRYPDSLVGLKAEPVIKKINKHSVLEKYPDIDSFGTAAFGTGVSVNYDLLIRLGVDCVSFRETNGGEKSHMTSSYTLFRAVREKTDFVLRPSADLGWEHMNLKATVIQRAHNLLTAVNDYGKAVWLSRDTDLGLFRTVADYLYSPEKFERIWGQIQTLKGLSDKTEFAQASRIFFQQWGILPESQIGTIMSKRNFLDEFQYLLRGGHVMTSEIFRMREKYKVMDFEERMALTSAVPVELRIKPDGPPLYLYTSKLLEHHNTEIGEVLRPPAYRGLSSIFRPIGWSEITQVRCRAQDIEKVQAIIEGRVGVVDIANQKSSVISSSLARYQGASRYTLDDLRKDVTEGKIVPLFDLYVLEEVLDYVISGKLNRF